MSRLFLRVLIENLLDDKHYFHRVKMRTLHYAAYLVYCNFLVKIFGHAKQQDDLL